MTQPPTRPDEAKARLERIARMKLAPWQIRVAEFFMNAKQPRIGHNRRGSFLYDASDLAPHPSTPQPNREGGGA